MTKTAQECSFIAFCLCLVLSSATNGHAENKHNSQDYVTDELIVKFRPAMNEDLAEAISSDTVSSRSLKRLNRTHKVKKATHLFKKQKGEKGPHRVKAEKFRNIYILKTGKGTDIPDAVEAYSNDPNVEYAEPNYIISLTAQPDDPGFGQQWALNNTGQTGGTIDADIDAPEAWDMTTGDRGVIVAVIDTGVKHDHDDLSLNIWDNSAETDCVNGIDDDQNGYVDDCFGYDFYNGDNDPMDDHGHGTQCAGIIAASGNNGTGISGIGWDLTLMPIKVFSSGGAGTTSTAAEGILYAADNGARVMSNSWRFFYYSQTLQDAVEAANEAGVVFVAASGNESRDLDTQPVYPAAFDTPNVITVASTNHNDSMAGYSNYGLTTVDLGAPGVNIYTTTRGGSYGYFGGTSAAAPHVAGTAGLVISREPSLSEVDVKEAILSGVDPASSLDGNTVSGGRLNAVNAILSVCSNLPARIPRSTPLYYTSIQGAYDASFDGEAVQVRDAIFMEDLLIDQNKSVSVEAGYDCNYTGNTGETRLIGNMTITQGSILLKSGKLIIE